MPVNFSESVLKQKSIIIITFFSLFIYLIISYKLNIWVDESFTISATSAESFKDLLRRSIFFEGQPPFYFIIVFFWAKISNSVFFLRLLSTLFTISSGLLLYKLYKKNSGTADWLILILVFANPFMIYLATEIRCYSLVVLFSLLLILLFKKYYSIQNVPILIRVIFILISIAAVNTQYFIAFLLLSNAIYLLIKSYRKTFITYLVDMCFVLISISWVPFFITKQIDILLYKDVTIGLKDLLRFVPGRFNDYIFNRHLFPNWIFGYFLQAIIILAILLNLFFKRRIRIFISNNLYLFVQSISISFCFLIVYIKLGDEFLSIRHTAILFPIIFLLFLRSFDYFQNRYFKGLLIFTVFSFYFICSFNYYNLFVKDFDVIGSVEYLTKNSKENQPIIIINNQLALPFLYYFNKRNETYVLPYVVNDSTGFSYINLKKPFKREEIEKLLLKISKNNSFWILNFVKPEIYDKYFTTIIEILNNKYSLESDTIIVDPKKLRSFKDLQIRKFKINEFID